MIIKTRVWDSKHRIMITNENVKEISDKFENSDDRYSEWDYYHGDEVYPYYGIWDLVVEIEENDRMKVMLSTGIADKKNNEIFQSDIVQPSNKEIKYYVVVWINGGFQLEYKYIKIYEGEKIEMKTYLPINNNYVVVGDIYRNPDLINTI